MKTIKFGDKHLTLQEWNRFNKIQKDSKGDFVPPGNDYNFRNHATGKMESLTTITTQEILLSKYNIILDGFETKWTRRYHKITKVINMKNFDKGMKTFDKSMQSFSKGMGETNKINKQNKKNLKIINGKPATKAIGTAIWGVAKDWGEQLTEDQTKKKKKRKKAPNQCTWKSNNSVPIYSRKQPKFF